MNEFSANAGLAEVVMFRRAVEATAERERRKLVSRGDRQVCRPSSGECREQLIEAGVWPVYSP